MPEKSEERRGGTPRLKALHIGLLLLVALAVAAVVGASNPEVTLRYQISIEAEVGGKIRTGSGVLQIRVMESQGLYGGSGSFKVYGEAIPLDLGDGRHLFLLLTGDRPRPIEGWSSTSHSMTHEKFLVAAFRDYTGDGWVGVFRPLKESKPEVEVPISFLPKLSISDELDQPYGGFLTVPPDALEGLGIKIRRITVAITEADVTRGRIGALLPWLQSYQGHRPVARSDFIR